MMPATLLIAGNGTFASYVTKGDIVEVLDGTVANPGNAIVPPKWVILYISDRTKAQVDNYLTNIKKAFDYVIDVQNAQGVRATVSADQTVGGAIDLEVKQEVKDYILAGGSLGLSVSLHQKTQNSLTVNIALPNDETRIPTLQAFKADINDKFEEQIGYRRYFFDPVQVDDVINNFGGKRTVTAAQAAANIIDRFA